MNVISYVGFERFGRYFGWALGFAVDLERGGACAGRGLGVGVGMLDSAAGDSELKKRMEWDCILGIRWGTRAERGVILELGRVALAIERKAAGMAVEEGMVRAELTIL